MIDRVGQTWKLYEMIVQVVRSYPRAGELDSTSHDVLILTEDIDAYGCRFKVGTVNTGWRESCKRTWDEFADRGDNRTRLT